MSKNALGLALLTILLWSLLAYLGAQLSHIPPLLLVGIALTFSGLIGSLRPGAWKIKPKVLLTGVGGIFGYHFFYFSAFHFAPAVEANLINYLWPLLIVVLSPLILPGYGSARQSFTRCHLRTNWRYPDFEWRTIPPGLRKFAAAIF